MQEKNGKIFDPGDSRDPARASAGFRLAGRESGINQTKIDSAVVSRRDPGVGVKLDDVVAKVLNGGNKIVHSWLRQVIDEEAHLIGAIRKQGPNDDHAMMPTFRPRRGSVVPAGPEIGISIANDAGLIHGRIIGAR